MSETSQSSAKPRLWLRILLVLVLLSGLAGALAYQKNLQFAQMEAQNSVSQPPISVTVASAEPAEWNRSIRAVGTLVAFQGVDITTEESGIVTSINFESGDEVTAGTLLIELDNRTEKANLESAMAQYEADNSQYQRLLKLKDQSFVTRNDIDTQASLVDIARARINVARTALSKRRIYAPFSGKLGIRQVDLGEYIAPGTTVVRLLSMDRLYLDFTLPESNYRDLAREQLIEFRVRPYPERVFSARVETWNPQLDASTRNISIRAVVDNRERLLAPGMFADMQVRSRRRVPVLTVPETSIFYNIYGEAVYVLEQQDAGTGESAPDYRLAARQVEVAYRENDIAGIRRGIEPGDLVVTSGQLKLYPNLRVAIVDDVAEYPSTTQ